jgi:hypothetical protein
MKLFLLFLLFSAVLLQPALALDPGAAEGSLQVNEETISLSRAYSHLHDNSEGLLHSPKELRILLVDREVSQEALEGIAFLPVEEMAKEGRIRGLMLQLDPGKQNHVLLTLLYPPASPEQSLTTQTIESTPEKVLKELKITGERISGEIAHHDVGKPQFEDMPKISYTVRFSAPLFHEPPVTADLKGKAAQDSPQALVIREKARALAQGDFDALKRVSTQHANRQNQPFLASMDKSAAKEIASDMEKSISRIQRVVVRNDRAVAIFPENEWVSFVREDGKWKSDD